jgi:hypothetical protein
LPKLLEALRASGRKLFLATNSLWDYTHVVMNFLLSGRTGARKNMDWLEYFDAVITGAACSYNTVGPHDIGNMVPNPGENLESLSPVHRVRQERCSAHHAKGQRGGHMGLRPYRPRGLRSKPS